MPGKGRPAGGTSAFSTTQAVIQLKDVNESPAGSLIKAGSPDSALSTRGGWAGNTAQSTWEVRASWLRADRGGKSPQTKTAQWGWKASCEEGCWQGGGRSSTQWSRLAGSCMLTCILWEAVEPLRRTPPPCCSTWRAPLWGLQSDSGTRLTPLLRISSSGIGGRWDKKVWGSALAHPILSPQDSIPLAEGWISGGTTGPP